MQLTRTSITRRTAVVLTAAAVAAGGVAISSAAGASPTRHVSAVKHVERFTIGGSENHQVVIAHGLFTAGGKDDASHDNYDVLRFAGGTLRITHPDKDSKFVPKINTKTCYGSFTITGKYTVGHGTGKYRGVTGRGKYRGVGEVILPRTKTGACSLNADPKFEVFTLRAAGPISR